MDKKIIFSQKVFDITNKPCYNIIVTNYGINYFFYNYQFLLVFL